MPPRGTNRIEEAALYIKYGDSVWQKFQLGITSLSVEIEGYAEALQELSLEAKIIDSGELAEPNSSPDLDWEKYILNGVAE